MADIQSDWWCSCQFARVRTLGLPCKQDTSEAFPSLLHTFPREFLSWNNLAWCSFWLRREIFITSALKAEGSKMSAWFLCCGSSSGNVCFPSSAHAVTLFSSRWVSDASLGEAWPCSKVSVSSAVLAEVCGLSASVAWVINLNSSLIYFFISEFFFRYNFHGMQSAYIKHSVNGFQTTCTYLFACVYIGACVPKHACKGQRITCVNLLSVSPGDWT